MERKTYASVTAILRWPPKLPRGDAEENLDCSFHANSRHAADFENAEVRIVTWQDSEQSKLKVELRLTIRMDTDIEFEELMSECQYAFTSNGEVIPSELTGWSVEG